MRDLAQRLNIAAAITYQHTTSQLSRSAAPETCAALCRRVAALLDARSNETRKSSAQIACAPGCHFCCHLPVAVFAHEAVTLFRELRRLPDPTASDVKGRILENAARIDSMVAERHLAANLRCAFLVDGRCSAYAVRPSACAAYHSMSREHCQQSHDRRQDFGSSETQIPTLLELHAFGEAQIGAIGAGTAHAGLSSTQAELHQALRALIQDPQAVERWQRGDELVMRTAPGR
jgi:Fe-S-cluster containining protein